ncbi:MAG: DUF1801 domain-containing protein [Pseudomonadota bacterium]
MAKAVLKTSATNADVQAFLNSIEPDRRREDGLKLLDFMNRVTGLAPKMWGPSMVGYGRYAYKYESGREGEYFLTGFSPRKSSLTVYVMPGYRDLAEPLSRLGKHKLGKSCLYINKLSDVEMDVLEEIVREGVAYMRSNYETWDT